MRPHLHWLVTLALVASCSAPPPSIPTDQVERGSVEMDVLEAVFRY